MAASCETTITPLRASHTSQETILRVYAIVNGSFPFQYEIIINRAFQHGLIKLVLNYIWRTFTQVELVVFGYITRPTSNYLISYMKFVVFSLDW